MAGNSLKDLPSPFWVAVFILMATVLAVIALYAPTKENVTMAVIAIASNIVSGSFGYISGHKDGEASAKAQAIAAAPTSTPQP
jgi:hypothetical protein